MGGSTNPGRRHPRRRRAELLVLSLACLSISPHSPAVVAALIVDPAFLARTTGRGAPARGPRRAPTRLHTKYAEDDFASFGDFDREGQGRQLAHEFYQEVEQRQKHSSRVGPSEDDGLTRGRQSPNEDAGRTTIRAVRLSADGGAPSDRFTNQSPASNAPSSSSGEGFPLSLFPFFSVPAPAPTSAGLFSGSGNTVYSSGRSVRAEIEILETTIKNSEAGSGEGWDGIYVANPEQLEEVLRLVALSLLMAGVVYVAVEASGDIAVILDGAASSASHAMNLMSDATKDGVSSIMIGVGGNGEVFMGEEAAWLMKESSDLAASVAEAEFPVNFKL
ncbi:hypothetical protein ACHAXT_007515 [Thalassiosira profunda]